MIRPKTAVLSVAGMKSLNSISENARWKYSCHDIPLIDRLGDVAAEDAAEVHDGRQQRHREDAREDARHREELERVDGDRFERVDLLGDLHRAELGADAGADAARRRAAPATSGPVSRISAIASPAGIIASAPKRSSEARVCIDSTTPMAKPDSGDERHRAPADLEDVPGDFA